MPQAMHAKPFLYESSDASAKAVTQLTGLSTFLYALSWMGRSHVVTCQQDTAQLQRYQSC